MQLFILLRGDRVLKKIPPAYLPTIPKLKSIENY